MKGGMFMNEDLASKRLKLYFAPLLPIDKKKLNKLHLSKVNVTRVQAYSYNIDIYKELFSYILLELGKVLDERPSYKLITVSELMDDHFDSENRNNNKYIKPKVLFIVYSVQGLENSYTKPIIEKVIEERKIEGKKTFLFYKGNVNDLLRLKISSIDDIIDFNTENPNDRKDVIF